MSRIRVNKVTGLNGCRLRAVKKFYISKSSYKAMFRFHDEKSQALAYVRIQDLNQISIVLCIPITLAIIGYSSYWADIAGRSTDYTDPTKDWQACFTQAQFITIPLNTTLTPLFQNIITAKNALSSCILGLVTDTDGSKCATSDGTSCVLDIVTSCATPTPAFPVVSNVQLPAGAIINSLRYGSLSSTALSDYDSDLCFVVILVFKQSFLHSPH